MTELLSAKPFGTRGFTNGRSLHSLWKAVQKPFGKRLTPPEDRGLEPKPRTATVIDLELKWLDDTTLHRRMAMAKRHIASFDPQLRNAAKDVMEHLEAELMRH